MDWGVVEKLRASIGEIEDEIGIEMFVNVLEGENVREEEIDKKIKKCEKLKREYVEKVGQVKPKTRKEDLAHDKVEVSLTKEIEKLKIAKQKAREVTDAEASAKNDEGNDKIIKQKARVIKAAATSAKGDENGEAAERNEKINIERKIRTDNQATDNRQKTEEKRIVLKEAKEIEHISVSTKEDVDKATKVKFEAAAAFPLSKARGGESAAPGLNFPQNPVKKEEKDEKMEVKEVKKEKNEKADKDSDKDEVKIVKDEDKEEDKDDIDKEKEDDKDSGKKSKQPNKIKNNIVQLKKIEEIDDERAAAAAAKKAAEEAAAAAKKKAEEEAVAAFQSAPYFLLDETDAALGNTSVKKLCSKLLAFDEVSIKNENCARAAEDFNVYLEKRKDKPLEEMREIAETQYQPGMALSYQYQFDEAVKYCNDAKKVLSYLPDNLKFDTFGARAEKIDALVSLSPQIQEKIQDTMDGKEGSPQSNKMRGDAAIDNINIEGEKVKDKVGEDDNKELVDKCDEMIKWPDAYQLGEVDEFNNKQKEVAALCNPIVTKLYVRRVSIMDNGEELIPDSLENLICKVRLLFPTDKAVFNTGANPSVAIEMDKTRDDHEPTFGPGSVAPLHSRTREPVWTSGLVFDRGRSRHVGRPAR